MSPELFPLTLIKILATSSNSVTLCDTNGKTFTTGTYRRLSDSEMQSQRDKGLCYFCDEKYSGGHRCKRKELNLFIHPNEEEGEIIMEATKETATKEEVPPTMLETLDMEPTEIVRGEERGDINR